MEHDAKLVFDVCEQRCAIETVHIPGLLEVVAPLELSWVDLFVMSHTLVDSCLDFMSRERSPGLGIRNRSGVQSVCNTVSTVEVHGIFVDPVIVNIVEIGRDYCPVLKNTI